MKSSRSGFRVPTFTPLRAVALGGLAALFAACGQSPGQTGLDYVDRQNVRVSAPLYHLRFDDLPVDSVFGTELPQNHFGDSLLVVGRQGDYEARARLGFQLTTTAQRDSIAQGLSLRLTALPLGNVFAGRDWLRENAAGRDTLTLLVESFAWPDSAGDYRDSLNHYHRRLLTNPQPFSTMVERFRVRDTIRVSPSAAYTDSGTVQDSSQAGALVHLHERLTAGYAIDSTRRWLVYLELSPLTTTDTGMFRFIGQAAVSSSANLRRYNSGLWLGHYVDDSLQTAGTLVTPYRSGYAAVPAANYEVRHAGASTRSVLHGVARGVHLRINRDTLINRIRLKLNALDPTRPDLGDQLLGSDPSGNFDRRFYVPYAEMHLPIDTAATRVDGPFALDISVASDVDSLGVDTASFNDDVFVATGASLGLPVYGGNQTSDAMDTLVVTYRAHPADTSLRQVLTHWANSSSAADTFTTVPDGRRRELSLSRRDGWLRTATLTVAPETDRLRIEVHFNVSSVTEPSTILNSNGEPVTTTSALSRRFWRPGADSLTTRVTRGLQNLLNRTHAPGVVPDLFLRTVDRAAYDTTEISGLTYRRVVYPVFGEIDFKRAVGGRLEVGLDLYLYPLEARP